MLADEQRQKMHEVRVKQAVERLDEIGQKQQGLINGNFMATARKFGLKVKELRKAYDDAKAA